MVADFETSNPMPPENWAQALNRLLPRDIRVRKSSRATLGFNSRFYARARIYEYRVSEEASVEPWKSRYVYEAGRKLDVPKMVEAVQAIVGRHDFRAFGEELEGLENAVREVASATVRRVRGEIRIRIEATAFIRGMMRRIAGGLVEVGRGKRSVEEFERLLDPEQRETVKWPVVLPAKGLTLIGVKYGRRMRDLREETQSA
jgi:tRNA pseudouridine38-40 synthase